MPLSMLERKRRRNKKECKVCGKKVSNLPSHLPSHSKKTPFECKVCSKQFKSQIYCTLHMRRVHERNIKYTCSCIFCNKAFTTKLDLCAHVIRHIEEKPYCCSYRNCGKSFCTKSELQLHHRAHTGEKAFKCLICHIGFNTPSDLRRHEFRNHPKLCQTSNIFCCDICSKMYTKKQSLTKHKLIHDSRSKAPLSCDLCGKGFFQESELYAHLRRHVQEKIHICSVCSISYSSAQTLKSHQMKAHQMTFPGSSVREYKCDVCEKMFYIKEKLKEHMLVHTTERPLECGVCKKTFKHNSSLSHHLMRHQSEDKKSFGCTMCDKKFFTMAELRNHLLHHTGEKSYKCSICGKAVTCASHLRRHEGIHAGELFKSEQCVFCHKKFASGHELARHILAHIKETPYNCKYCDASASSAGNLRKHVIHRHQPIENRFWCVFCTSAGYNVRQDIFAHLLRHVQERPYVCKHCDADFTSSANRKQHFVRMHS